MKQEYKQILLQKLQQTILNEQFNLSENQIASLFLDLLAGKSAKEVNAIFAYSAERGYSAKGEDKVIVDKLKQKGIQCFINNSYRRVRTGPVRIEKPEGIKSRYSKVIEYYPHETLCLVVITEKSPYLVFLDYELDKMGLSDQELWEKLHKEKVDLVHRVTGAKAEKITYDQLTKIHNWEYHRDLYRTFDWVPESDKKRWASIDKQDEAMRIASEREGSAKFTFGT